MKRPFGLIGLTYLTVLAVAFYSQNIIFIPIIFCGVIIILFDLLFLRNKPVRNKLLIFGITIIGACVSITLYTNMYYTPIINDYSDKELIVSGYISEEIQKSESSITYTITTEKINGEDIKLKINLVSLTDLKVNEFEYINAKLYVYGADSGYNLSKGIFLSSYYDGNSYVESMGKTKFSLYSFAVSARIAMKKSLDSLLSEDYSALCKAILLGDKKALSYDIKSAFSETGTSFLIVVSGMHLAIVVGFVLFILKKINKSRKIQCIVTSLTVFIFMAITGFTPSVIRSGIMVLVTCGASLLFRRSDSVNSLGIAALVLTVFNPYSVGDIGMLLSFSATFGIVIWSKKITDYVIGKFNFKNRFLKYCINAISVSLSASLWIIPITTIAFGTISPYVVIISFLSQPIVSLLLIFAMLTVLFYLCPFISFMAYPCALVAGLLAKLCLLLINFFASLPYCSVNSDKIYFYVWIAVSILLVVIGYAIKAKVFYIKCSIIFSFSVLILGWGVYSFVIDDITVVKVYNSGYGVTASVECGDNITLLSCGGLISNQEDIVDSISRNHLSIDNVIVPKKNNKYAKYMYEFINEFDVSNVLVYDISSKEQTVSEKFDEYYRSIFSGDVHFTLNISDDTFDEVFCIDGVMYQYVSSKSKTMLFVSTGADISKLPKEYRECDYLLIDSVPENYTLLNCKSIILAGEDDFEKYYDSLIKITDKILYSSDLIEINF